MRSQAPGQPGKITGRSQVAVNVDSPQQRRVFVACEGNAKTVIFDLGSKAVTTVVGVGDNPDVLALDPGLHST